MSSDIFVLLIVAGLIILAFVVAIVALILSYLLDRFVNEMSILARSAWAGCLAAAIPILAIVLGAVIFGGSDFRPSMLPFYGGLGLISALLVGTPVAYFFARFRQKSREFDSRAERKN